MKNIFLFTFVFGAVIFTSIQAKEEVAKLQASRQTSLDVYKKTTYDSKPSAIVHLLGDEETRDIEYKLILI